MRMHNDYDDINNRAVNNNNYYDVGNYSASSSSRVEGRNLLFFCNFNTRLTLNKLNLENFQTASKLKLWCTSHDLH